MAGGYCNGSRIQALTLRHFGGRSRLFAVRPRAAGLCLRVACRGVRETDDRTQTEPASPSDFKLEGGLDACACAFPPYRSAVSVRRVVASRRDIACAVFAGVVRAHARGLHMDACKNEYARACKSRSA